MIFCGSGNLPYEKTGGKTRCIADEIPFEIPDSWAWVRCGSLFFVNPRNAMPDDALAGFMPMPMLCDGFQNKHSFETKKWGEIKNGFTHFADGDIVIAKITPCFQNRKSAIIAGLPNSCGAGTTELHVLRDVSNCLFMPFFLWLFKTNHFIEEGKNHFSGTAGQQRIGRDFIATYLIPLPPLAEQVRVVAKIEELLPHIEEYDRAQTRVEKLNAEFPEQLKKSILQWAIQGKLVPQDPSDEPASELLKKIKAEKEALVKAGKLKKAKTESVIFRRDNSHYEKLNGAERCIDDEIPFEIPDSWAWIRLGEIGKWGAGATPSRTQPEYYKDATIPWLKTGDLTDGYITNIPERISKIALEKTSVNLNPAGSILIAMYGATIGKLGILTFPSTTNQACCACSPLNGVENLYLFYFLMAKKTSFIQQGEGGAQPNISKEKIIATLMPLPPLAEQKRIVSQIEKLFSVLGTMRF